MQTIFNAFQSTNRVAQDVAKIVKLNRYFRNTCEDGCDTQAVICLLIQIAYSSALHHPRQLVEKILRRVLLPLRRTALQSA